MRDMTKTCPKCGKKGMIRGAVAGSGKVRWTCQAGSSTMGTRVVCYSTTNPGGKYRGKGEPEKKLIFDPEVLPNGVYVFTWAQNATPIHKGFFASLMTYVKARKASLFVQSGRYKNPTSTWEASQKNEQWWDPAVVPYLINVRKRLNSNLVLMADTHTQPTADSPLTGFESHTHGESGILPHPKLQLVTIPTPHQRMPKIMTTTGAVTKANYTDTKAGKKGEFHHIYGAVVVEIDGPKFHLRHLNARADGAFCDLDLAYYPDGTVADAGPYLGLVFGDTHVRFTSKAVDRATFGPGGLVERLRPKTLVFHDLLDSYAVNPHHEGDPFIAIAKRGVDYDDMAGEVQEAIGWLSQRVGKREVIVVPSNHDDMFRRWIKRKDWRSDPVNAVFYLETALHMAKGVKMTATGTHTPDPFHYWVQKRLGARVNCLPAKTSFTIAGIELSLHGHEGPNGARGSIKNLSKLGVKVMSGHGHAFGIEGGHMRVATSTELDAEYTGPISSWLQGHGSIDPMGKRHLHVYVDGRFWK